MIPTPPVMQTPQPIFSVTPAPASERAVLDAGLDVAMQHAQALDGTLGAMVIDLTSGAVASRNADRSLPAPRVQRLAIAVVAYRALDAGSVKLDAAALQALVRATLIDGDADAEQTLTRAVGGIDAVNAGLRDLGYDTIVAGSDGDGYATASAVARLLTNLYDGHLLRSSSRAALLETLASARNAPLRPGDAMADVGIADFHGRAMIVVALLASTHGSAAARDAAIADVARAAADAASSLTP